ncbi:YihY/virulence factor BrkB family protein [Ramlibacter tataouinensis]|uniref:Candidate membrane protein n=1 Tax=Ramlibacter tataouinensis (strain ATCC BAA-407 / DSM 14655 / LMG 21543 / TTB310) TaxID=365046 RepID=F5Y3B7_RAMTT|nr:YihY/virulence factor BrkB family protein [Ramlibacter tataouinensis]AEG91204.1 candidate membrane protein [Ramlibacter tataouinensis TTB310]
MAWTDHLPAWALKLARTGRPLYRAFTLWSDANGMRMSAAMSFYGILSLAPLLVLVVAMLGWWLDREMLEQNLVSQIGGIVGEQGASVIREALASAQEPSEGIIASIIGFLVLLFGATGVFGELQEALERLWVHGTETVARQNWWYTASLRLRGVAYVLAFGFLLLVSLVISTLLNIFSGWAGQWLAVEVLLRLLNELATFGICAALFVALMRLSAGPKPRTRYLIAGALIAALLFIGGRQLMTAYLSTAAAVSAYGAAGSLVVLLMWIYFSSAVLLFGAGCAKALEEERGLRRPRPRGRPDAGAAGGGYQEAG